MDGNLQVASSLAGIPCFTLCQTEFHKRELTKHIVSKLWEAMQDESTSIYKAELMTLLKKKISKTKPPITKPGVKRKSDDQEPAQGDKDDEEPSTQNGNKRRSTGSTSSKKKAGGAPQLSKTEILNQLKRLGGEKDGKGSASSESSDGEE